MDADHYRVVEGGVSHLANCEEALHPSQPLQGQQVTPCFLTSSLAQTRLLLSPERDSAAANWRDRCFPCTSHRRVPRPHRRASFA